MVTNEEHATKTWKYNKLLSSIVPLTLTTQQKTKLSEITFWFADFKFLLKENIGISPGDYSEKNNIYTNIRFKKP